MPSLYDVPSLLIVGVLLSLLVAGVELGHRLGRRRSHRHDERSRDHVNGIQSATLALLALLLAFTVSLALQRFDSRSQAVVDEANAIGTALLRADLLAPAARDEARAAIERYLALRVQEAELPLHEHAARTALNERATRAQADVWAVGVRAAQADAGVRPALLYVQAVNDLIDSFGRRNAALDRHVPELVTLLLFATFVLAGGIMGYATGVAAHRPSAAAYVLIGLMTVLMFVVLDLDRPRRGVIQVSHESLVELRDGLRASLREARPGPAQRP